MMWAEGAYLVRQHGGQGVNRRGRAFGVSLPAGKSVAGEQSPWVISAEHPDLVGKEAV